MNPWKACRLRANLEGNDAAPSAASQGLASESEGDEMTTMAQVPSERHSAITREGYEQLRDELTALTTISRAQIPIDCGTPVNKVGSLRTISS